MPCAAGLHLSERLLRNSFWSCHSTGFSIREPSGERLLAGGRVGIRAIGAETSQNSLAAHLKANTLRRFMLWHVFNSRLTATASSQCLRGSGCAAVWLGNLPARQRYQNSEGNQEGGQATVIKPGPASIGFDCQAVQRQCYLLQTPDCLSSVCLGNHQVQRLGANAETLGRQPFTRTSSPFMHSLNGLVQQRTELVGDS